MRNMEKNNGKIAIAIVVMFVVALSIIGGTYAYFVAGVVPNTEGVNVTVQAGTLKITYNNGTELKATGIVPGWASDGDKYYDPVHSVKVEGSETRITAASIEGLDDEGKQPTVEPDTTDPVTFDVENPKQQGSEEDPLTAYYAVALDVKTNSIVDKDNFKVTLKSTEAGIDETVALAEKRAEDGDYQVVSDVITILPNAKHNYTLSAQYDNITSPQQQGKAVDFEVKVIGLNRVDTNGDGEVTEADGFVDADGNSYTVAGE